MDSFVWTGENDPKMICMDSFGYLFSYFLKTEKWNSSDFIYSIVFSKEIHITEVLELL